jgi:hypothetical protein
MSLKFKIIKEFRIIDLLKVYILSKIKVEKLIKIKLQKRTLYIRTNSSDFSVICSSFIKDELSLAQKLYTKNFSGLIIDAGGYIGTAAIKLSEFFPRSKIISLEPSNENFKLLKRNTEKYRNIIPIQAALVDKKSKKIKLLDRNTGKCGFTIIRNPADCKKTNYIQEITPMTIYEIQKKFRKKINILKMDIEGSEKSIFDNNKNILENIDVIIVELHDRIISGCLNSFKFFSKKRWYFKSENEKYLSLKKFYKNKLVI